MDPCGERLQGSRYWGQGGSDFAQEKGTLLGSSFVHSIVAQGAQMCQGEEKCMGVRVEWGGVEVTSLSCRLLVLSGDRCWINTPLQS